LKALEYTPRFGITYKGPGWRHLNTKNDTNVEKLLQKDKTDTDLSENSIHKAQDDMHLLSDSDRDGSQPIKENAFPLREEHYRFNPAKSSDASSPGKEDSEQPKLKSQDQDKHSEGIAEEESKTLQTKESPSLQDKSNECDLHAPGYDTFRDLRSSILFVDKTDFILKFDQVLPKATCILRPRRSGKSLAISMLKEFYSLPKIDVMSYFPDLKEQESKHESSKSPFEGTKVFNPEIRKQHFKEHESEKAESFIKDNMNQWPVIVVDLQNITFSSRAPTQSEIRRKLLKYGIQEVFEQYDYLLFIKMVQIACQVEYGLYSEENVYKLYEKYNLGKFDDMRNKIQALWRVYNEQMKVDLEPFYKLYIGDTSYEDIETSLKTLTKILKGFYHKKVIVLVDEHDSPVQRLYENISLDNPKDNIEVMKSINCYSKTLTDILKAVAKGNADYTEKFLMFGISNSIVNAANSGLNNVDVKNVFDEDYVNYFTMTQEEVDAAINRIFDIQPKLKDKIISSIKFWYNGYYRDDGLPLYSIFSVSLYISDCYKSYKDNKISQENTSDEWIPKPSKKWAGSTATSIFNNYLNFGFKGNFNFFVLNLYRGIPACFKEMDKDYVPLLQSPTDEVERAKIIFHLLMHGGYLTKDNKNKTNKNNTDYRIPNEEIKSVLENQLLKYLREIPIQLKSISDLTLALQKGNFEKFGNIVMKDLFNYSTSYKFDKYKTDGFPLELYIHLLL
jgi:hypothetical protein